MMFVQAMLAPPNAEPEFGAEADGDNLIDTTDVDIRLPMLVYVSREKRPGYDHPIIHKSHPQFSHKACLLTTHPLTKHHL